jgi:molybdopterin converting factor small subunit
MHVSVVCFGRMRDYLPNPDTGRTRLEITPGATVRSLVDALGAPEANLHSVLIDGLRVDLDTEVRDGAEVTLMPPFAGGS